ncbi:endo-1,3-beta-glucanase Engl1 [Microthyrium microscopicum]|uniref:glucan endo-1,3-beta-D-glucosidase n=1 Tax=Microthyrium microscopicum TaxID=703497 RepID=A0A6A6USI0_9PEZI|nr:endo-1,3-beta-glucanase Engl1 [Microthyrium microscopicum]
MQRYATQESVNPFIPFSDDPPVVARRPDHPVSSNFVKARTTPVSSTELSTLQSAPSKPLYTNKFYANLFLEGQTCPAWTMPYSVWWSHGGTNSNSWGMSITLIEDNQIAYGPANDDGCCKFYLAPIGIQNIALSAAELGPTTSMTVDSMEASSANINFSPSSDAPPILSLPLVQGMGFVTGVYRGCTPYVQSSVFFRMFIPSGTINNGNTEKYRVVLEDGAVWLIYRTMDHGTTLGAPMQQLSNTTICGDAGFKGFIQIAKLDDPANESVYDTSAGAYAVSCTVAGIVSGSNGRYSFIWEKTGLPMPLLMYALPHHLDSFAPPTSACVTNIKKRSTTKGVMAGVLADQWIMIEKLPIDIGFAPWTPATGSVTQLSDSVKQTITAVAAQEVEQDVMAQCCLNSMYFSGKGLAKFAMMIFAMHDMANCPDIVNKGMSKLKDAFATFVNNTQPNPLVYEDQWKGVVSVAGLNGDPGQDFGNSYYNDHHFHYGYFLYAAAVLGYVDPSWLADSKNKAWVDMLVRDFANSGEDTYFPFSRSFDWFCGHSWAKGLFASGDGKDQESSSEDAFASYSLKMWGHVTHNSVIEAGGDLRLALQARVFQKYFLMESTNTTQPASFISNKVTGILFENKCDHSTYFSPAIECIQGIHMIPVSPVTALIRTPNFVQEEWCAFFDQGRVDQIQSGWNGLLQANHGLLDPKAAYEYFAASNFNWGLLDGGASRTWYLAYFAAIAKL